MKDAPEKKYRYKMRLAKKNVSFQYGTAVTKYLMLPAVLTFSIHRIAGDQFVYGM